MSLSLGEHSYKGDVRILCWTKKDIVINVGKFCSLATNIKFVIDGNHYSDRFSTFPFREVLGWNEVPPGNYGKEIPSVGNDVWIASDVTIYSGVIIGDGAIIAGQSVVTKSVPPYAIVGGNPAKIIRYRFTSEIIEILIKYKWWDLPLDIIKNKLAIHYGDIDMFVKELTDIKCN
jgi:acetyltransferase-like isoleucine patch superfamily enzyme